ncbi:hypothetical protein L227DRAFT_428366 [Lentinus tigrinus ALCF2SS1-6]|uniref:Uncharacterized protein n=1 Tax=Lentinus tigrinus ALCF2SS1-6 TaxID=1328759 RepID=A0A5C2RNX0_9APHY|nr:hypothetical protein L227DRAFT_428366 [Lentinus tigrinus ALCF2SS1-6]
MAVSENEHGRPRGSFHVRDSHLRRSCTLKVALAMLRQALNTHAARRPGRVSPEQARGSLFERIDGANGTACSPRRYRAAWHLAHSPPANGRSERHMPAHPDHGAIMKGKRVLSGSSAPFRKPFCPGRARHGSGAWCWECNMRARRGRCPSRRGGVFPSCVQPCDSLRELRAARRTDDETTSDEWARRTRRPLPGLVRRTREARLDKQTLAQAR